MDYLTMFELIGQTGFPIFIALIMVHNSNNNVKAYTELYHKLKESVDNNSRLISELMIELRKSNKD